MRAALTAATLAAAILVPVVAEAQQRRGGMPVIRVQPRSYFDAGKIPAPGSLSRYSEGPTFYHSPVWQPTGELFGEGTLPPRLGAGANPFGRF